MSLFPGAAHLGTYRIICADPPWSHNNYGQAKHGAAKSAYDEMTLEDIERMPVGELAHPDGALLLMWCTGPQAADGAHTRLASAWGFRLVTRAFAWVKVNDRCAGCGCPWDDHRGGTELPGPCVDCGLDCDSFAPRAFFGPGNYTGGNVEDVWLGVRGDATWCADRATRDVRQVVFAPAPREHSRKPDEVQARIERLWPSATPRLELFARRRRHGWAAWGNEAPDCDLVFGADVGTSWPVSPRAIAPAALDAQGALFAEAP
jgi:N6-adenosine-specific RNA methylase IME4